MMRIPRLRSAIIALTVLFIFPQAGCVTFRVGTVPPPPPQARLRVYVQPISSPYKPGAGSIGKQAGFGISHAEFAARQLRIVRKYLEETGIYDVVSEQDVDAVIGDQAISWHLLAGNNWALARELGKALHAEYAMVMERAKSPGVAGSVDFVFTNVLINTETGQKYGARYRVSRNIGADDAERRRIVRATYKEIFRNAKEDLLATALRKAGRIKEVREAVAEAPRSEPARAPAIRESKETEKPAIDYIKDVNEQEGLLQATSAGAPKLVVYDLETSEQYKPAALIITDALREELFQLRRFVLVNRENLQQVLQEMALQQTGLIDEKEAVKTGKGLAANQVVMGRMGMLGTLYVLQAKRVDVETLATLGFASASFAAGHEDEVMLKLPEFAKRLADLR